MSVPSATGIPTSYAPPRRVDPRFAYHTLSAGLVPVNEFRSKQSLWSSLPGGWDGLGNFVTNSAYQVWGTKRESGLSVIQVPRYFYDIHGSITRGKLAPIQFNRCSFGVFCLSTVDHLMYERLIWVNLQILPVDPPIRRYAIELYFVVDYCSGRD